MGFMTLWFGIIQPAYYLFLNFAFRINVYAQTQIHLNDNSLVFKITKTATQPYMEL